MKDDHLQNSEDEEQGSGYDEQGSKDEKVALDTQPPSTGVTRQVASITTKTGDDGSTGLLFGGRVRKDDPVIEAVGALDEAQAAIGMARAYSRSVGDRSADDRISVEDRSADNRPPEGRSAGNGNKVAPEGSADALLERLERDLWILMAEVSGSHKGAEKLAPGKTCVTSEMVDFLGRAGERLSLKLDMPKGFAVPGETVEGSLLDNARVAVRRAERRVAALSMPKSSCACQYLNRLSDLLWIMARLADGEPRMVRYAE